MIPSSDGKFIVFNSNRKNENQHDLFVRATDVMGSEEVVLEDSANKGPLSRTAGLKE